MPRFLRALGLASLVPLLVAAPAWAAPASTAIETVTRPTPVAAFGGVVAWSRYDRAAERYRLVLRIDGRTRLAPVPTRHQAFDVGLGPSADGRGVVAVYSRCAPGEDRWRPGDCDVYRYDLRTRRETRVRGASSDRFSETLPAVWGSRIAYVRSRAQSQHVVLGGRRFAGSSAPEIAEYGRATGIALGLDRLAFTWAGAESEARICQSEKVPPDRTGLWTVRHRGPLRTLLSGCPGDAVSVIAHPSLSGSRLDVVVRAGSALVVRRTDLRTGVSRDAPVPKGTLSGYAQDGSSSYFALHDWRRTVTRIVRVQGLL